MVTELRTPRLLLRAPILEDAPAHFELYRDPEVRRYLGRALHATVEESETRIKELIARCDAGEIVIWSVTTSGTWVGVLGLHSFDRKNDATRVGYEMLPAYWGQGLMGEALRVVLGHAFEDLGLHRVEAHTSPDNTRSVRVLERLGFRREGLLREAYKRAGGYADAALYARLASDPVESLM